MKYFIYLKRKRTAKDVGPTGIQRSLLHLDCTRSFFVISESQDNNIKNFRRYIPSAIAQRTFPSWDFCSTTSLRTTNAALLFALPFLIFRILTHFRTAPYPPRVPNGGIKVRFLVPEDGLMIEAVVIACFPLAYFSGFLYYTDLASVCAVLACYDLSLQGRHYLAGFVSLLEFRGLSLFISLKF